MTKWYLLVVVEYAVAMEATRYPLSFVCWSFILGVKGSKTIHFVVFPVALIITAIWVVKLTVAVAFFIAKLADVFRTDIVFYYTNWLGLLLLVYERL